MLLLLSLIKCCWISLYVTLFISGYICRIIFSIESVEMSWNIGDNRNVFLKLRIKLGLYHVLLASSEQTPKKVSLTIVEMQQLPEVRKFDSENEISCLRWIIFNGRKKFVFCKTDTDYVGITEYRYRNNMYMKDSDIELKATEYNTLLQKEKYLLSYLETFSKKIIVVEETNHHSWHFFAGRWTFSLLLMLFNLTRDWTLFPIQKNTVRRNLLFSVCHCLHPKIAFREMNDLYTHGGLIGYGDSYLDSVLCYSKMFCLHAILHDAAGAVYTEKRKVPGYCYMIGRGTNSCLFGDITRLLFCLYLKFFVPSILNRFNCWPKYFD